MLEFSRRVGIVRLIQNSHFLTSMCYSQTSVSAGRILRMGKGFTIEGVEGYDLSTLFQEAFERKVIF